MNVDQSAMKINTGDLVDIFFEEGRISGQVLGKSQIVDEWTISTWFHDEEISIHDHFVYPKGGFQKYADTFKTGQVVAYEGYITVVIHITNILFGDEKYRVPVVVGENKRFFFTPMNLKKVKKM